MVVSWCCRCLPCCLPSWRGALCPHVSPDVLPRGCRIWGLCVQAGSEPLCQVMAGEPETHGTQHGDIPRNREAQAWPLLLWSHGACSLCEVSNPLSSRLPLC